MGAISSLIGRKRDEMKAVMVGLDAAGKTTILYQLKSGEVVTTIPTIGMNVETVESSRMNTIVNFTAWDVGGRDKIRPLWRHYYKMVNSIVFVVDSNDRDEYRLEEAQDELQKMLSEDDLQGMPLLVFANKQDLPNAMSVDEVVNELQLNRIRGRQWHVQASCARTGDGLKEGLDWLSNTLKNKGEVVAEKPTPATTPSTTKATRSAVPAQSIREAGEHGDSAAPREVDALTEAKGNDSPRVERSDSLSTVDTVTVSA